MKTWNISRQKNYSAIFKILCSITLVFFCLHVFEMIPSKRLYGDQNWSVLKNITRRQLEGENDSKKRKKVNLTNHDPVNTTAEVQFNTAKRLKEKKRNDEDLKKASEFSIHVNRIKTEPTRNSSGADRNVDIIKSLKESSQHKIKNQKIVEFRKDVYMKNYRRIKKYDGVNCLKIVKNDQNEITKSKRLMRNLDHLRQKLPTTFYLNITRNCSKFRHERGYINHPLSEDEYDFPLAFSLLTYTDIELTERLLRLIYRPHNFYCLHIDSKMSKNDQRTLRNIANCLSNVLIANESIDVKWGKISLIEAELACMKTLWSCKNWKYYINLAGQEFPLKTNRQIVAILKELDGANIVSGSAEKARTVYAKRYKMAKSPPPHNITLAKGSMHVAVNRYFVDFCLHDQRSLDFLDWLKQTKIPDEFYFSSLNYNPHLGIKGSFTGKAEPYDLKPYFLRYVIWQYSGRIPCNGKFVREVCIIGIIDLHKAYNSTELFVNKFHLDFEHIALDCLEEVLYEQTWEEYMKDLTVNTSFYKALDYAKLQLKV